MGTSGHLYGPSGLILSPSVLVLSPIGLLEDSYCVLIGS